MNPADVLAVLREAGHPDILTDEAASAICRAYGCPRNTANDPGRAELLWHVADRLAKFLS